MSAESEVLCREPSQEADAVDGAAVDRHLPADAIDPPLTVDCVRDDPALIAVTAFAATFSS
jgi:hypothetical protein